MPREHGRSGAAMPMEAGTQAMQEHIAGMSMDDRYPSLGPLTAYPYAIPAAGTWDKFMNLSRRQDAEDLPPPNPTQKTAAGFAQSNRAKSHQS